MQISLFQLNLHLSLFRLILPVINRGSPRLPVWHTSPHSLSTDLGRKVNKIDPVFSAGAIIALRHFWFVLCIPSDIPSPPLP